MIQNSSRKIIWVKFQPKDDDEDDDISLNEIEDLMNQTSFEGLVDEFNFWIMHSNFTITIGDIDTLKKIPGVESLDLISQYRLRFAFGELFEEAKVKSSIAFILDCISDSDYLSDDSKEQVEELKKTFSEDKLWIILVLPNGQISSYVAKDERAFEEKLEFYEGIKELTSCQLITSQS